MHTQLSRSAVLALIALACSTGDLAAKPFSSGGFTCHLLPGLNGPNPLVVSLPSTGLGSSEAEREASFLAFCIGYVNPATNCLTIKPLVDQGPDYEYNGVIYDRHYSGCGTFSN